MVEDPTPEPLLFIDPAIAPKTQTETWLISGQSNSVFGLDHYPDEIFNNFPELLAVNQPYSVSGGLEPVFPGNAFSGVGFYFAYYYPPQLRDNLRVIANGIGATEISTWQEGGTSFESNFRPLIEKNIKISGIIWWQGESDAFYPNIHYVQDLTLFFDTLKKYFGPDFKIVIVEIEQISEKITMTQDDLQLIRDQQKEFTKIYPNTIFIPTADISDGLVHPADKRPFAKRIIHKLYGE